MKIDLSFLDKKILADLKAVGVKAQSLGYRSYLVGGVVRDVLLKRSSSDWDIVVEGNAIDLAKEIVAGTQSRLTVYEQFGTATIEFADGTIMDLATARSEHYPRAGSLPVVKSGSIKEDLFRRDFTINALAVVLNVHGFGELQDFYGGYADLKNKKLRVLHEQSFIDDPTRILRAIRFEARLGFRLESKTLQLLKIAVAKKVWGTVKPPRYFSEFRKIFSENNPAVCLKRLAILHGLDFIDHSFMPDWKLLVRLEKSILGFKKDKFYSVKDWAAVYFLAFFARVTPQQSKHFAKHFHFTKEKLFCLVELSMTKDIIQKLQLPRLRSSEIYEILDPVDLEIIYFIRAVTSANIVTSRVDDFLKKWRNVSLQITGEDLKGLGLKPGREMGVLLHTLLLYKLDGKIKSHQDEIILAKRLVHCSINS